MTEYFLDKNLPLIMLAVGVLFSGILLFIRNEIHYRNRDVLKNLYHPKVLNKWEIFFEKRKLFYVKHILFYFIGAGIIILILAQIPTLDSVDWILLGILLAGQYSIVFSNIKDIVASIFMLKDVDAVKLVALNKTLLQSELYEDLIVYLYLTFFSILVYVFFSAPIFLGFVIGNALMLISRLHRIWKFRKG